jgi:DNA-binding SARP family transcriptional activator
VLAFLAMRSRPLPRPFVAGTLWPDVRENRAGANLRAALWRLPQSPELLTATRTHLELRPEVEVDLRKARARARALVAGDGEPLGPEADGLTLDLLPSWNDEWVAVERERFRQLRLHALETVCRSWLTRGEPGRAIDVALTLAEDEPLRESLHRVLVEAHLAEGNQLEALRAYGRYTTRMRRELGLPPSSLMEEAIRPLRSAHLSDRRELTGPSRRARARAVRLHPANGDRALVRDREPAVPSR